MELFSVWAEEGYSEVAEKMLRVLERKMADIGDVTAHPVGKSVKQLREMYPPPRGAGAAARGKAEQHNLDH